MKPSPIFPLLATFLILALLAPIAFGAKKEPKKDLEKFYETKTKEFTLRLVPRTADQMAGFYEGRGFSAEAIEHIRSRCFVTALVQNHSDGVVWLELANWQFSNAEGVVERAGRPTWKREWTEMGVSAAHQATFGWTLMPEERDLRPEEPLGGNITLPRVKGPVTLKAVFYLGADKGEKREVSVTGELCR